MNPKKYICLLEKTYENNLNQNESELFGIECLYLYRTLGLNEILHNDVKKFEEYRDIGEEFTIDGRIERSKMCYYRIDRKRRGSDEKGRIYVHKRKEWKTDGKGRYKWSEAKAGITMTMKVFQLTLLAELISRYDEIMQRPVTKKMAL